MLTGMKTVQPEVHIPPTTKYHSISELQDLIIHMERFSVGVTAGVYQPLDPDFKDLAVQIAKVAGQLRDFMKSKEVLSKPHERY